jgi:hypothetical protein
MPPTGLPQFLSGHIRWASFNLNFRGQTPVRSLRTGDFFSSKRSSTMEQICYPDEEALRNVVEQFEHCTYALAEFTHARHLTVACWYVRTLSPEDALSRMRTHLQKFSAHHGKQGYHETITRFWIELLNAFLAGQPPNTSFVSKVNNALQYYGNKDVLYSYYTRERVMSEAARREWVEPDLTVVEGQGVR